MRKFTVILALCLSAGCSAASVAQESEVTNVQVEQHPASTTCELKHDGRMSLLELGRPIPEAKTGLKVAAWTDPKPVSAKGPPATLSINFNKPGATGRAWMILFAVQFQPGSTIDEDKVSDWTLSIDGVMRSIPKPPQAIYAPMPAPAPGASSSPAAASSSPSERGPDFLAGMDDDWFQRIFTAHSAVTEFRDADGKVLGRYEWDVSGVGKAREILDRIGWSCGAPT